MSIEERLRVVKEFACLNEEETQAIRATGGLRLDQANRMIENAIGTMELPLGIAANFLINGKDYLIPMALEEPSVVAAASNIAKIARVKGGFQASSTQQVMIGQVQLTNIKDFSLAKEKILARKSEIIQKANEQDPILVKLGGGCQDVEARIIDTKIGKMLIVHLLVDCQDAMGANAVNTMAEAVAPLLEEITGGRVFLRIISNLAVHRLARAQAVFDKNEMGGEDVVDGVIKAYAFALADPFRAATHNKGIMNGVDAVAIATGNDFRAVEAGAHAYAAITGTYLPLTRWEKNEEGDLVGSIELPLAVGLVGGATATHPIAKANVKILGVKTAKELAEVMAAVGLAQNLGALKALATEGIQRGHMSLHSRNIAIMAGAVGDEIEKVAGILVNERKVRLERAREVLESLRKSG